MNERQTVKNIIADKCRSSELFTSLDITKTAGGIRHRDVRSHVRSLFESSDDVFEDYSRTQQRMDNGDYAFVYHPSNVPASYYQNRDQSLDGSGGAINLPTPPLPVRFSKRSLRPDGTIELPGVVVKRLKADNRTLYARWNADDQALILSGQQPDGDHFRFKVYTTGECRIPKRILDKYRDTRSEFDLKFEQGDLHISM